MYTGPPIDEPAILDLLPGDLRGFLLRCNGYVAFHGGFHVRGACLAPTWHSLRHRWFGPEALQSHFAAVHHDDIPFGEDALGDQYLLRRGVVYRLAAETGELKSLEVDLQEFDIKVRENPVEYLSLGPLEEFRATGGTLAPGQLLSVFPPFAVRESAAGVSYRAIPADERIRFLADFARQISDVPDGAQIELRTGE